MLSKFELYQPAAIDNSLNSYQIIHKLIHEMNIIIDEINNIDSKANEYTDERVAALKAELLVRFDIIENGLTALSGRVDVTETDISALNRTVSDLRQTVIDNYTTLDAKIDYEKSELLEQIAYNYNTLLHYIDSKIDVIMQLIESITGIKVYGIDGRVTHIQNALDYIYKILNPHTDITINQLLCIIDEGYTTFTTGGTTYTKNFSDITIDSILNCTISESNYMGGDYTTSNYYFFKLIVRTDFNNLIKTPFYNFFYLLLQSALYQWSSEAQQNIPVMITNIWRWCAQTFSYPTQNNAIYLNSTYSNFNEDASIQ